jgi:predicted ABC-type ATPase
MKARRGDRIYFQHKDGPVCGDVLCAGKHGAIVDADGRRQKVRWEHYLGHRERMEPDVEIVSQGADGMMVADADGRREYVAGRMPKARAYGDALAGARAPEDGELSSRAIERKMHGTSAYHVLDGDLPAGNVLVGAGTEHAPRILSHLEQAGHAHPYQATPRTAVDGEGERHGYWLGFDVPDDGREGFVNEAARAQRAGVTGRDEIMVFGADHVGGMEPRYVGVRKMGNRTVLSFEDKGREGFEPREAFVTRELVPIRKGLSIPSEARVLFKAGGIKGRPGLGRAPVVNKRGVATHVWKRQEASSNSDALGLFDKQLDLLARGKTFDRPLRVGRTPKVLRALGAPDAPLNITEDTIWKAIEKHDLTPREIKGAVRGLYRPIMVFDSATAPDSLVAVVGLARAGKPLVAAVHLDRGERIRVNRIASIHGKDSAGFVAKWCADGLLRYWDKDRARDWARSIGLQLPKEGLNHRLKKRILQPKDVFKEGGEMRKAILFFKAEQLGLFDQQVPVKGYTRSDGTYVKPHQARHKKRSESAHAQQPTQDEPTHEADKAAQKAVFRDAAEAKSYRNNAHEIAFQIAQAVSASHEMQKRMHRQGKNSRAKPGMRRIARLYSLDPDGGSVLDRATGHAVLATIGGDTSDAQKTALAVIERHLRWMDEAEQEGAQEKVSKSLRAWRGLKALFLKAGPVKNRPGLSLQDVTEKDGHHTKRWKKTGEDAPKQRQGGGKQEDTSRHGTRGAAAGYGTSNIEAGDKVRFESSAGKTMAGKVVAEGKDGATVRDGSGGEHKVPWKAMMGHAGGGGGEGSGNGGSDNAASADEPKKKPGALEMGQVMKIAWQRFSASKYFQAHNDPDVTAKSILKQFPDNTSKLMDTAVGRLEKIEETIDQYKRADGTYEPEREKLHEKIIGEFLSPERLAAATPGEGEAPTLTLIGGRGGSGKSKFAGALYDPEKTIVIDPDEVKKGFKPAGYEGWNASTFHEESSDVTRDLVTAAFNYGVNVVIDKTMASPKFLKDVESFKKAGYRVEAHYMFLPRAKAAERAVSRFLTKKEDGSGRLVPPEVVLGSTENEANFDKAKQLADEWSFWSNDVEMGASPVLVSGRGERYETSQESTGARPKRERMGKAARAPVRGRWAAADSPSRMGGEKAQSSAAREGRTKGARNFLSRRERLETSKQEDSSERLGKSASQLLGRQLGHGRARSRLQKTNGRLGTEMAERHDRQASSRIRKSLTLLSETDRPILFVRPPHE